jgi:biotin carboxylase
MRAVVFVAPFFAETTLRFVNAAANLEDVRLALVSQDPADRLPAALRARLCAHRQVADGLDSSSIVEAVRELADELGPCQRLLGALEQLQVPLARVRETLGIPGMGVAAAENFRDKARMKQVLQRAGIACARHRLASSREDASDFVEQVGFPVVVKPPAGAGARHTLRVEGPAELAQALKLLPPDEHHPVLLEEFITGEEHSFDAVSLGGRTVWHSLTHYRPGPLEVMENPWIQWTVLLPREIDHPRYDDIRDVATRALGALGMDTGLSHMEWFRRRDGSIAVSEVAARPPGAQFTTLISYAHDLDFYRAWARLMVEERFEPPPRRYAAGIAFLRGQGQGRVCGIHGLDRAQAELGELVVEVRLPRAGQAHAAGYEGEGYVVLRHPDTDVVASALERLVRLVRVELGPAEPA